MNFLAALALAERLVAFVGSLGGLRPAKPEARKPDLPYRHVKIQNDASNVPEAHKLCRKRPDRHCQADYGEPARCEWCDREMP